MSLMQFFQTKMNLWLLSPSASNRDCDVVCARLSYIADPAIRVANEKSVLRTFYLFKLASSSKLARSYKKIKAPSGAFSFHSLVIPLGLEPRTHTLKVYCSTN